MRRESGCAAGERESGSGGEGVRAPDQPFVKTTRQAQHARSRALECMRTYTQEWTEMSLHQHTTVLRTGCVCERERVDVCESVFMGSQYLGCVSGYE